MSSHADFEALSAFLDGEAPEWAPHVGSCDVCRAALEEMRAVQTMLAAPVEPVDPARRAEAIAAAIAAASPVAATSTPVQPDRLPPRADTRPAAATSRQPFRWLVPASVAALFVVVVGAVSLLSQGGRSSDELTTAGPALESADTPAGQSRSSATSAASGASLGEVPDAATLLARARPGLVAKDSAAPAAPGEVNRSLAGTGGAAVSSAGASAPGATPCEAQARAREPSLMQLVYFATATRQGVPAYVLGFSTGPPSAPVTLLLLAQDGCGVLLRAAGP